MYHKPWLYADRSALYAIAVDSLLSLICDCKVQVTMRGESLPVRRSGEFEGS